MTTDPVLGDFVRGVLRTAYHRDDDREETWQRMLTRTPISDMYGLPRLDDEDEDSAAGKRLPDA